MAATALLPGERRVGDDGGHCYQIAPNDRIVEPGRQLGDGDTSLLHALPAVRSTPT